MNKLGLGAIAAFAMSSSLAMATTIPAAAAATDITAVMATWSLDLATIQVHNANQVAQDPNTTCTVKIEGNTINPTVTVGTGVGSTTVYGNDAAAATGACESLDTATSYGVTLTAEIQSFHSTSGTGSPTTTTGTWKTIATCSSNTNAIVGAGAPTPVYCVQSYAAGNPDSGHWHRGLGTISNTKGQVFQDLAAPWLQP
jgi:hypothetical protein